MATNANPQQPLDRAIWATWYDLPEADRAAHLPWLHGEYIPGLLERPGHLWAAHYEVIGSARDRALFQPEHADDLDIGKGKDFLLLIGAASPHDFFRDAGLTAGGETDGPLAQRREVRTSVFVEEVRVDGPAVDRRTADGSPGPAIQMGSLNLQNLDAEFDLSAWYVHDRLPATTRMPGCIGTRKLVSTAGWAKHSVLYEFVSHEARESQFHGHEKGESEAESWSKRVINATIHAPGSPTLGTRIGPEA